MRRRQQKPRNQIYRSRAMGFILLLILAASWETLSRLNIVNSIFLPPLTTVATSLWKLVVSKELLSATGITLGRCATGYSLAAVIGIPLGVLMGKSTRVFFLFEPLVESLRPIPSAAIIPIAILFLGIDNEMKIAVIVFGSLWPILLNTIQGVQVIDPMLLETGRTLNLSKRQLLLKIILPASSPSIITGLRISLAISLILSITVEMIAGSSGLGFLILDYERSFKYAEMYAGIVSLGVIGLCLNAVFSALDRRYLAWAKLSTSYAA